MIIRVRSCRIYVVECKCLALYGTGETRYSRITISLNPLSSLATFQIPKIPEADEMRLNLSPMHLTPLPTRQAPTPLRKSFHLSSQPRTSKYDSGPSRAALSSLGTPIGSQGPLLYSTLILSTSQLPAPTNHLLCAKFLRRKRKHSSACIPLLAKCLLLHSIQAADDASSGRSAQLWSSAKL